MLHSGLYYPPGSFKARLCVAGNRELPRWCETHGVPHRRVGKLIVATTEPEQTELEQLLLRARANGVEGITALDGSDVRSLEPSVCGVAALWVPSTGILEAPTLVDSLGRAAVDRGVTVALRHHVTALEPEPGGWSLEVASGPDRFRLHAQWVINAAGLHADAIASLAGLDVEALGYRQHWVKGRYVRVRGGRRVTHLVYPVPPAALSGLGVHLTIGLDGDVRLGPDVVPLEARVEDYAVDEDCIEAFHQAARRFIPSLTLDELAVDTSGIRPKLSRPGGPWRDFVVFEESAHGCPGLVTLAGIESPGLTCSMELAREVDALVSLPG